MDGRPDDDDVLGCSVVCFLFHSDGDLDDLATEGGIVGLGISSKDLERVGGNVGFIVAVFGYVDTND